jgi:hypothetical protein
MFRIKDRANPVGVAYKVEDLERKIAQYAEAWREQRDRKSLWSSSDFSKATAFVLYALDDFILTVMAVAISGPDKKATVLDAVSRLYDFTAAEVLPIWLRPVAMPIKQYVVYVLVSVAIDWIVSKYKEGGWKEPSPKAWDGKYVPCRRGK